MNAFRNPLIAKVHIGKQQLRLDDETYRGLLQMITGKLSCSKMSHQELEKVLDAMKARSFRPTSGPSRGRYSPTSRSKPAAYMSPLDKLRALWIQMGKD